jgi:hypothetical protein
VADGGALQSSSSHHLRRRRGQRGYPPLGAPRRRGRWTIRSPVVTNFTGRMAVALFTKVGENLEFAELRRSPRVRCGWCASGRQRAPILALGRSGEAA